ncbi:MAG: HNH endonuclease, partial [Thaumarchaeota archaeon]|nr:HNH endonuclease [Nitrososphaerota archaeon]
ERNYEMTEAIKKNRGYVCQVCHTNIPRKGKPPYVEAAHITPKPEDGIEIPSNIMILCPNHHKMFDKGDCNIISRTNNEIRIKANGEIWPTIDLRVRE